ncbi:MAG: hypothetical protein Q8P01_02015 [bacterium]|nr:hypothetical protein [bacterium]MDP2703976.1 hypothetical protein [bacterium]
MKVFVIFFLLFACIPWAVFGGELSVTVSAYTSEPGVLTSRETIPEFGTIAVSKDLLRGLLPYGTCVLIPEVYPGHIFRVEDAMHKRWTNKLDIWVGSREEAVEKVGSRKNIKIEFVVCPSGSEGGEESRGEVGESRALYDSLHNIWIPAPTPLFCKEDLNRDGIINIIDLVKVARAFGSRVPDYPEDVNGDGVVNIIDLVTVARRFGQRCDSAAYTPESEERVVFVPVPITKQSQNTGFASVLKSIFWVIGE